MDISNAIITTSGSAYWLRNYANHWQINDKTGPSLAPTAPPTFCSGATFKISKQVTNVKVYDKLKTISNIILYGGESIISSNCKFMFKLEWSGNLFVKNMFTKDILWQTNTTLINDYSSKGIIKNNIKLFMANDTLYVMEDKYPTNSHLDPNILWKDRLQSDSSSNQDEDDWQIVASDNGYMALYRNQNGLILQYTQPTMITQEPVPTVPTNDNNDDTTTTTQSTNGGGAASDDTSQNDGLIWLWITIAILFIYNVMEIELQPADPEMSK